MSTANDRDLKIAGIVLGFLFLIIIIIGLIKVSKGFKTTAGLVQAVNLGDQVTTGNIAQATGNVDDILHTVQSIIGGTQN